MDSFLSAIRRNDIQTVKRLAEDKNFNPGAQNNLALKIALQMNRLEIAKFLLSNKKINPSAEKNFALRYSVQEGRTEIVEILLADPRIDPSSKNSEAVEIAAFSGKLEILRILLQDPRVKLNNHALGYAAEHGHIDVVRVLLDDPRVVPEYDNNYALRGASESGNGDIVRLLLSDPRVVPNANILINAVQQEDIETVRLLLSQYNIDPSHRDNEAIISSNYEIAELLLQHPKVNPGAQRDKALTFAVENDDLELVKLFLSSPLIGRFSHADALQFARGAGYRDMIKLLEDDLKKYPTYEIRRCRINLDNQIRALEIKIQELEEEEENILSSYNIISIQSNYSNIFEEMLTAVSHDTGAMINKLKRELERLKSKQC